MITPEILITLLGGYLLGSIPFGLLIARFTGHGDIRKIGSGNIGATNVLRTGRKELAILTLVLDAGKAGVAALIAAHFFGFAPSLVAGGAALIGHCFPIWLKFKGGKGVLRLILGHCWPSLGPSLFSQHVCGSGRLFSRGLSHCQELLHQSQFPSELI